MAISVRFLFLLPLMLQTLAACIRPSRELIECGKEASVKGAPISWSDDMILPDRALQFARGLRGSLFRWLVVARAGRKKSYDRGPLFLPAVKVDQTLGARLLAEALLVLELESIRPGTAGNMFKRHSTMTPELFCIFKIEFKTFTSV